MVPIYDKSSYSERLIVRLCQASSLQSGEHGHWYVLVSVSRSIISHLVTRECGLRQEQRCLAPKHCHVLGSNDDVIELA